MSSENRGSDPPAAWRSAREGTVVPLLDVAFGFFVWMGHLVLIYVTAAVACGFGLVRRGPHGSSGLESGLVAATALAALVVALHGWRRWRAQRAISVQDFRLALTLGCDALAAVAILWQFFAIGGIPPCI